MTQPNPPTAIVRDALADLRPFEIVERRTAATFLAAWRRRAELTSADLRSALDHFPDPTVGRRVQLETEMAARYTPLPEVPIYADIANRMPPGVPPTSHADPASFPPGAKRAAAQMLARPPADLVDEFPTELGQRPEPFSGPIMYPAGHMDVMPDELGDDLDSAGPELAGFLARADSGGRMRVTDIDGPQILARLAVDRGYAKGLYHGGTVYQLQLTDLGRQFAGGAQ